MQHYLHQNLHGVLSIPVTYSQNSHKAEWSAFYQQENHAFLARVWSESSAGEFWSYRAHMLKDAVPVPPNVLAKNCLDWQVRYSAESEGNGSCFQEFIQSRVASTGDSHHTPSQRAAFICIAMPCSHTGGTGFPQGQRTVTAFRERGRSRCRLYILGESANH